MNHDFDLNLKRFVRVLAIALWLISIAFSAKGFGFSDGLLIFVGVLFAVMVTVLEVVLNREGLQLPRALVACGVLAYVYGIGTNIAGLWQAQGALDYRAMPEVLAMPVSLGILLEILPEPLFMWSLGIRSGDLMDTLSGLWAPRRKRQPEFRPPFYQPNHKSRHPDNPRHQNRA
jgi:hypothetical protein